jgi:Pleckstrin homology domain
VGKDRQSWQELECYLFSEMLICVKEKKIAPPPPNWDEATKKKALKCTLKGSILIKKHLKQVIESTSQGNHLVGLNLWDYLELTLTR